MTWKDFTTSAKNSFCLLPVFNSSSILSLFITHTSANWFIFAKVKTDVLLENRWSLFNNKTQLFDLDTNFLEVLENSLFGKTDMALPVKKTRKKTSFCVNPSQLLSLRSSTWETNQNTLQQNFKKVFCKCISKQEHFLFFWLTL